MPFTHPCQGESIQLRPEEDCSRNQPLRSSSETGQPSDSGHGVACSGPAPSPSLHDMETEELRTVVVTGASTGIGAACVEYLDDKGFRVFATVRKQVDADRIAALGSSRLEPLFLDVSQAESIAKAAQTVDAGLKGAGLAGLVNNAGISVDVPLECVDIGALRHQLEVNTIAPVEVTQAFLPLLRRARGRVVNVSSLNGRVATPFSGPYCMSKFALEAFTDCLRQELAAWGMHVAAVEPGAIDTVMWQKGRDEDWSVEASERELDLYGEAYQAFQKFGERNAANAIPCDAVSRAIFHALTARRPRTRYLVGPDARLYGRLTQVCPDRLTDWLGRKVMGLGSVRPRGALK
jgi:NAD(P)-dependent dehydrogenase (short-subunit alcohol dehydrogenase family)